MKIPLPDQQEEAELHRQALEKATAAKSELSPRLHRSEAICLTLSMYAEFETEFRQFMKHRKDK